MASYGLKYRAEFKNTREHEYRLDIYQRSYSGSSKTIKTLCGCALEIQGAGADITAPIIKTQLRFSLVDAWDVADTGSAKWGNWSEFYTPDATLYKVKLSSLSGNTATAIWTGYITPDSWQEDLGYRTAITITARDNIGHLKDFQFSMTPNSDGLIKISDLIDEAMDVIEFAMDYTVARSGLGPTSLQSITAGGVYLHDAYINAALLDGMNWYDVLERTIEAAGMCLRYVGSNKVEITYLRNMPKMGSPYASPTSQTLEFYGGSLEFEPAVKQIEEKVDFKMQKEIPLEILSGIQYGSSTTYRCKIDGNTLPSGAVVHGQEHDAPTNTVSSPGSSVWANGNQLLDPSGYLPDDFLKRSEGQDGWKEYAMIPSNRVNTFIPFTSFRVHSKTAAVKLTVNFTPHPLSIRKSGSMTGKMMSSHYSLYKIDYQVSYFNDDQSVTRYWDGSGWVDNDTNARLTREYDAQNEYGTALEIELAECEDIESGLLVVSFYDIKYRCWTTTGTGVYARVQSILAGIISTRAVDSDKVTTINNDVYNVKIERSPLFGALSMDVGFVTPQNYIAALYYYPSGETVPQQYPYMVRFEGQSSSNAVPLPVIIHQQILCYRHGAARVLSGRCAPVNKVAFDLGCLFSYKGTTYILQGGTIDYFSGIMEGGVFHEFVDFDDLWTGAPTYSGSTAYNTGTPGTGYSGGNSGSASAGSGAGYELPVASANTLGGIKVGTNLSIDANGVLSASGGGSGSTVSVSNLTGNGNKVADITIDGVTKTLKTGVRFGTYDYTNRAVQIAVGSSAYTFLEEDYAKISLLSAPFIEFRKGYTKSSNYEIEPAVLARHPAMGRISGAQFVLMVYSHRRGRNSKEDGREGCFARKGWGAALGKTGHSGLVWTSSTKDLVDIREYILHNYIAIAGEAKPSSMTYATFQNKTQYDLIGFSGKYSTSAANFKYKKRRRFGIAVRWQNPVWTELGLTGTINNDTTEYNDNGTLVRRWIYTDVAEFMVHVGRAYASGNGVIVKWVIGFEER